MPFFNKKAESEAKNAAMNERRVDEVLEPLPEPQAPPPTDPRLPLNARQVFKLKKSWKGVKRNMEATGMEMFIRLFRNNAELKLLFREFNNISDDNLRENETLEAHGMMVMSVIDEVITNIDNVDHVLQVCTRIGGTHCRFTGFRAELFLNMETPFLDAAKIILGDRYSEAMDEIYRITIKFILNNLQKGFTAGVS